MRRFMNLVLLAVAVTCVHVRLADASQSMPAEKPGVLDQEYVVVTASGKDSLATLALRYYGDEKKAWIISDFNHVSSAVPGVALIIPPENVYLGGIHGNGYQTVPVLAYHRFSLDTSDKTTLKKSDFEAQIAYLKEEGYHGLTVDEFYDFLNYQRQIPAKSVMITMDDGWKSAFDIAVPILQKYGFTATWFLYTDFIGGSKAMSWDQVRQLALMGFDIQVQSKTHSNLGKQNKDESMKDYIQRLETEILQSRRLIEKNIGKPCKYLAYPYGVTNGIVIAMLKKYGYCGAFTVNRGTNPFFVNHYAVHRSLIYGEYDLSQFKKNLTFFKPLNMR